MKKLLLLLATAFLLNATEAQTVVTGRQPNHYYRDWYDTCYYFFTCHRPGDTHSRIHLTMLDAALTGSNLPIKIAVPGYSDRPLSVKGIAVMQSDKIASYRDHVIDTLDKEYISIGYFDSAKGKMEILATARWDSVTPKTWMLPMVADPALFPDQVTQPVGMRTCFLYEAYFDHSVTVDSLFYMIGTQNGNRDSVMDRTARKRVRYQCVSTMQSPVHRVQQHNTCYPERFDKWYYTLWNFGWEDVGIQYTPYGPFIPIIDGLSRSVKVHSADTLMGYGSGGPFVIDSTWTGIHAYPNYGFRFTHWNDGDTNNPRQVFVTGDTAFTAYFDTVTFHTITVTSNNSRWGAVQGSGTFPENLGAPIWAVAIPGHEFVRWSDGVYNNERVVYMTCDTNIMAIFRPLQDTTQDSTGVASIVPDKGVTFTLSPNPTTGSVVLNATDFDSHRYDYRRAAVVVLDVAGHEAFRTPLIAPTIHIDGLAPGVYFVTLITPQASATQRLVVK